MAGNKEMTHERLLEISRLDGRKRGRERGKKSPQKIKREEEREWWVDETNRNHGKEKKVKLGLTTNTSTQRRIKSTEGEKAEMDMEEGKAK